MVTHRFSKSRSVGVTQEIHIPVQQSLTKYSDYQLAMPLADTSKDHSLSTAVCGKQITSSKNPQYESAIPIYSKVVNYGCIMLKDAFCIVNSETNEES
jgi:hypothetical protein